MGRCSAAMSPSRIGPSCRGRSPCTSSAASAGSRWWAGTPASCRTSRPTCSSTARAAASSGSTSWACNAAATPPRRSPNSSRPIAPIYRRGLPWKQVLDALADEFRAVRPGTLRAFLNAGTRGFAQERRRPRRDVPASGAPTKRPQPSPTVAGQLSRPSVFRASAGGTGSPARAELALHAVALQFAAQHGAVDAEEFGRQRFVLHGGGQRAFEVQPLDVRQRGPGRARMPGRRQTRELPACAGSGHLCSGSPSCPTTGSTRNTPGTAVVEECPARSACTSCDTSCTGSTARPAGVGVGCRATAGRPMKPLNASGSISSPDENITARSSTFSSSRTLPGHEYDCSTSMAGRRQRAHRHARGGRPVPRGSGRRAPGRLPGGP